MGIYTAAATFKVGIGDSSLHLLLYTQIDSYSVLAITRFQEYPVDVTDRLSDHPFVSRLEAAAEGLVHNLREQV